MKFGPMSGRKLHDDGRPPLDCAQRAYRLVRWRNDPLGQSVKRYRVWELELSANRELSIAAKDGQIIIGDLKLAPDQARELIDAINAALDDVAPAAVLPG